MRRLGGIDVINSIFYPTELIFILIDFFFQKVLATLEINT